MHATLQRLVAHHDNVCLMQTKNAILLSALMTSAAVLAGYANAQGAAPAPVRPATVVQAQPIRDVANPMSRAEGREAAESSIAGALVGIATEQFDGERIEVQLETVDMEAVSPRDRKVSGTGLLKVGNDTDWLPFRYRALYDTETQAAGWAAITLGADDAGGEAVANHDAALGTLAKATSDRMQREFPQQAVSLDLANAQRQRSGRYLRYLAHGAARFDAQDPTPFKVEGLYDPAGKRWVRVNYELGDTAHWAFSDGTAPSVTRER